MKQIHFHCILIILISFWASASFAQTTIDSLEAVVKNQTGDEKFNTLSLLVDAMDKKNLDRSLLYSNQMIEIAMALENKSKLADAYGVRGTVYLGLNKFDLSEKDLMNALSNSQQNKQLEGKIYNNLGQIYAKKGEDEKALEYYKKSLQVREKISTKGSDSKQVLSGIALVNINIGSIYVNRGEYKEAVTYYYKALSIQEELNNVNFIATIHSNLGNIYLYGGDYEKAILEYKQALKTREKLNDQNGIASAKINLGAVYLKMEDYKNAEKYFSEALIIRKNSQNFQSLAGIYENLGIIRKNQGRYKEAMAFYKASLDLRLKESNKKFLVNSYANIGNVYYLMKDFDKAEEYLNKGIALANELKTPEAAKEIYSTLSRLNQEKGKSVDALNYYKKYIQVKDSINNVDVQTTMAELKEKYEAEKKNKVIERLKQEKKYSELQISKKSQAVQLLSVLFFLATIVVIVVIWSLVQKRRSEREIFAHKEEIERQKMLEIIKIHEVKNMDSYLKGQELERTRLAADLHDRLGSLLSTVKLHFSVIAETSKGTDKEKEHINYTIDLVDKSIEEVRHVSHNLAKGILTQFGLIAAVKEVASAVNRADQMVLNVEVTGTEKRYPSDKEIVIMSIIQELISNTIKHANATNIRILFEFYQNQVKIWYSDNGIGFNISDLDLDKGMGLRNMKQRMEKINEEISYESGPNRGVSVILSLSDKDQMPVFQEDMI